MKIKVIDGTVYVGRDEEEIMEGIRADSFHPEDDIEEFMEEVAYRTNLYRQDVSIRTDSAKNFINDQIKAGLWERVLDN